ncbi:signal transduction histidine kinase [Micromonospora sp. Llam0]|uniref:nitrate- and nitrite sensing domain-containing protein n=1 Tax=Micromonospora sp. Llam0 TaxID=2485143 RepID=UPI000F473A0F|nr:nitrate- and nitrite sensing domain-containing protein [Micromonospora sp. Llam0]ROO59271.1 signal transduction histidine kinase [Micromonospora sp. Llam0]
MVSRGFHLRTKIVALLLSLSALWAFAAWVTLRDGLNLLWVQTYDSQIYQPSEPLLLGLQSERRLAMEYLAGPTDERRSELVELREANERLADEFQASAQHWWADLAAGADLEQQVTDTVRWLTELRVTRDAVEAREVDRGSAHGAYTNTIAAFFQLFGALGNLDERDIADDTATLTDLNRSQELVAQQDALIAGVIVAERFTAAEHTRFVQLVGAQEFLVDATVVNLPEPDRARYAELVDSDSYERFRDAQQRIVASGPSSSSAPLTEAQWRPAADATMSDLHTIVLAGGDDLVDRAVPVALLVLLRLLLAAGLGMLAVVASIIMSITTARAIVAQLERLRDAAHRLAEERLPGVVDRLGRGEEVDVAAEAPPLEFGNDEIGQVGRAFNRVQETAVRTAVEQAELRRSVRDVFLSLARRTQALVHRQLTLLDSMERREEDADKLEELFRVDHLATRMRRNAENLIVLSGSTPGRTWRRDVPMVDVVRGAIAEVEDYTRVTVAPIGQVSLAGRAVADVIHLLAELIENALSFSPPHTTVQVKGQFVANGYVVEIEDRGLGMSDDERAAANERITEHPEFRLSSTVRLGLYVVSRLTERTGIRVHLKESPYGGSTAVVLIPRELVVPGDEATDPDLRSSGRLPAAVPAALAASDAAETLPLTAATGPGRAAERRSTVRAVAQVAATARSEPVPPPDGDPPTAPTTATGAALPTAASADRPAGSVEPESDQVRSAPTAGPHTSTYTPSGLPVRVRSTAAGSAGGPGANPPDRSQRDRHPDDGPADPPARPAEQVLRMMSAYQSGTRQGRSDAARLPDAPPPEDSATAPQRQSPATAPVSDDRNPPSA